MTALSPWTQRFVAVGLLVCLVVLFWSACLVPLWRWSVTSMEALKDARFELVRSSRALEASQDVSAETNAEIEQAVGVQLITGDNEANAVNQFQFLTDTMLKEQDLTLERIQATTSSPSGPLTRLGLEIRANGPEQKIMRFLASIEKSAPLIHVERLTLRAADAPMIDGKWTATRVSLEATLAAYWRPLASAEATQGP